MKRNVWFIAAMLFGGIALVACGSSGGSSGDAADTSTTTKPSATSSTAPGALPTLQLADTSLGKVVAGADGKVLYLYKPDGTAEQSTVPAGILGVWPPVVVKTAPTVGDGLDESLVSTGTQPSGAKWVRYNGHLLYGFTSDAAPGDTNGNGVGGVWYAVTAAGDAVAVVRLAADYQAARAAFLDAADAAGAQVRHHAHPMAGPDERALATDVAVLGAPDAPDRLVVISGTHGVEGFAGSLCQTAWLRDGVDVPAGMAIVIVHAINPYGFAWVRRVNEDNVDLNRNCVDFAGALPENPGYDALASALVPTTWDEATQTTTAEVLLEYAGTHGFDGLQTAVSAGQYRHPRGIFFGGQAEVWSQRTLREVVRADVGDARRVAIIDLHTGLGPFGEGELIGGHPDADGRACLDTYFDDYRIPSDGTSVSADVQGDILDGIERWLPETAVAGVAIEWGTVDIVEVSNALRADAWLHAYADPRGPEAAAVKQQLRAAFAPDDPRWAERVEERFVAVRDRALAGLAGG